MRDRITGVFPQLADVGIDYAWGGFVDVTMNRAPDLGRIGANIYYVQGFSGHGLVFAGMAGRFSPTRSRATRRPSTCSAASGIDVSRRQGASHAGSGAGHGGTRKLRELL